MEGPLKMDGKQQGPGGENRRYVMTRKLSFFVPLTFMIVSACASVHFRGFETEIRDPITLREVIKNPDAHRGKAVLWGGEIIRTVNKREGTLIEILQLPLDKSERPRNVDTSEGRFLLLNPDFLDVLIYRPGREITVVGEVRGIETAPLGEMEYSYPFIKAKKIHLWELRPDTIKVYHEYPPYLYRYPYCWGYPYW
jgi:outer membrane lipoprotein